MLREIDGAQKSGSELQTKVWTWTCLTFLLLPLLLLSVVPPAETWRSFSTLLHPGCSRPKSSAVPRPGVAPWPCSGLRVRAALRSVCGSSLWRRTSADTSRTKIVCGCAEASLCAAKTSGRTSGRHEAVTDTHAHASSPVRYVRGFTFSDRLSETDSCVVISAEIFLVNYWD